MPEVEPSAQTFDAWGFTGTSIYLATLWLAALKAVPVMAQAAGYTQSHQQWLSLIAGVPKAIMTNSGTASITGRCPLAQHEN